MDLPAYHPEAVQEIVDFLIAGKLFLAPANRLAIEGIPALVIDSLVDINRYRDPSWANSTVEYPIHWNDIVGDLSDEEFRCVSSWSREHKARLFSHIRAVMQHCWTTNHFGESRAKAVLPEGLAASDLGCLIDGLLGHRMVCGVLPGHMNETFWQIIQWGGVPCGWSGRREGMLVVYIPPSGNQFE